jgi:hypothetical protein
MGSSILAFLGGTKGALTVGHVLLCRLPDPVVVAWPRGGGTFVQCDESHNCARKKKDCVRERVRKEEGGVGMGERKK